MAVRWQIREIYKNTSGGVTQVHFCAWDEEFEGEEPHRIKLVGYYDEILDFAPDSSEAGFTPFENLTESQVVGWCTTRLGTERVAEIETAVGQQITSQRGQSQPAAFPW